MNAHRRNRLIYAVAFWLMFGVLAPHRGDATMNRRCLRCGRFARVRWRMHWFETETVWVHGRTHHVVNTVWA